jgi:hypothetical protein
MKAKKASSAAPGHSRRRLSAVRSLSPLAAFGVTLALVLGGTGVANASNGGNFMLGHANGETSTASLSNTKGTPLKLDAPADSAPLKVSNSNLVPGLNAQYLGGQSASQLAAGGDGFTPAGADTPVSSAEKDIASTGALAAGTYYVNATAMLDVATGDGGGFCFIVKGSRGVPLVYGGAQQESFVQAAETIAVSVNAGDNLEEWCYTGGTNGSLAFNAAITAIRVLSSSGTTPASTGRPRAAAPGRTGQVAGG